MSDRKILTDFITVCKRLNGYKAIVDELSKQKELLETMVKDDFVEDSVANQKMQNIPLGFCARDIAIKEILDLGRTGEGMWAIQLPNGKTVAELAAKAIEDSTTVSSTWLDHDPVVKQATAYLAKDVYGSAADGDKQRLIEVLKNYRDENGATPYREMVKEEIHHKTLQSIANEMLEIKARTGKIPEPIEKALKITEDYRAKVRFN